MAGVTFLLERHVKRPAFSRALLRESIEAFEAVGPWFLTLLCLATMGITIQLMTRQVPVLFYLSLTYASALSLMIASPFNTMLARFMADEIFRVNYQPIVNALITVSVCLMIAAFSVSGLLVITLSSMPLNQKIAFMSLSVMMSLFWCISSCLATLQKERVLLLLFSIGVVVILGVFVVTQPKGMVALSYLFLSGMAVSVGGGYAYTLDLYTRSRVRFEWGVFRRRDALVNAVSIFVFYLGFWIDKMVFWNVKKTGISYDNLFHYYPDYDFPFFVALTLMMVGSIFVYRGMKRKISEPYKSFIFKLEHNFPFQEIALEKHRIVDGIGHVSGTLLGFYGGLTIFLLFLVSINVIPLPWSNPFIFHYLMIGTIFFSLYFFYFLVLQYLDEFLVLLRLNLLFLLLNGVGTFVSVQLGFTYHGAGFLIASAATAMVSFLILSAKVGGLEYHVFMKALKQTDP